MLPPVILETQAPDSTAQPRPSIAPWYSVPSVAITSVEHPFIVHDVAKAITSLGGSNMVEKLVSPEHAGRETLLSLHPHDRMTKPVFSINVSTNNVLLYVTVPKRTGRKRKRGTMESYSNMDDMNGTKFQLQSTPRESSQSAAIPIVKNLKTLLRSLRDNADSLTVRPMGVIEQTHRFRDMPDFVYSTASNVFIQKMRDHILPFDCYEKSKAFEFRRSDGPKSKAELIPPPTFTPHNLPFNYSYRQNPSVKQSVDSTGKITMVNTAMLKKIFTQRVAFDVKEVPCGPVDELPPIATLDPELQKMAKQLEEYMEDRPIWTRRALTNQHDTRLWKAMSRHIYQYVGYMFRSGPWREAVVKYGVDPRIDPKYRIYQTMTFQFGSRGKEYTERAIRGGRRTRRPRSEIASNASSHRFDGTSVSTDGKVWQVCDITDPLLQNVLATTDLRQECHVKIDGWYHNGTWAKARCITKLKMVRILTGKGSPNDADYEKIAALPETYSQDTRHMFLWNRTNITPQEIEWIGLVRGLAGLPEGMITTQDADYENRDDNAYQIAENDTSVGTECADTRVSSSMQAYSRYEQQAIGSEGEVSMGNEVDEKESASSSEEDDSEGENAVENREDDEDDSKF